MNRRAKYGRSLFPTLLELHKEQALTWKADVLLPAWLSEDQFKTFATKLRKSYPKAETPAFVMLENAYLCERYNLHFVGRGHQAKEKLESLIIDCLCKDKRRTEERQKARIEVKVETIEDKPGRNPHAVINYLLKTSTKLAKKILPIDGKNYRDLGLVGKGGIRARKQRASKLRPRPSADFQALDFDPDLPDSCSSAL